MLLLGMWSMWATDRRLSGTGYILGAIQINAYMKHQPTGCPSQSPPMSNVSRGTAVEREVINIFRAAGWDCVRSAASKGKLAGIDCDMVASRITRTDKREVAILVMQAKRSRRK